MTINWYPGHMVRARRQIEENIKLVDVVLEVLDARAPFSCRNPDIERLTRSKPVILVLNKMDRADPVRMGQAVKELGTSFHWVVPTNAVARKGVKEVLTAVDEAFQDELKRLLDRGRRPRPARVMVIGVPNVGKSSLINALAGKKSAVTGPQPGVTRGKQWIRVNPRVEMLDMPGLMWPRIESEEQGLKLALLGIIGEKAYDEERLAEFLLGFLDRYYQEAVKDRYGVMLSPGTSPQQAIEVIGSRRGLLNRGGHVDTGKTARMLLDEFAEGVLGKISLD